MQEIRELQRMNEPHSTHEGNHGIDCALAPTVVRHVLFAASFSQRSRSFAQASSIRSGPGSGEFAPSNHAHLSLSGGRGPYLHAIAHFRIDDFAYALLIEILELLVRAATNRRTGVTTSPK